MFNLRLQCRRRFV